LRTLDDSGAGEAPSRHKCDTPLNYFCNLPDPDCGWYPPEFSMSTPHARPELRDWILGQARHGQAPMAVVSALCEQGWPEDQAIDLVQSTLQTYLAEHARENGLPPPSAVPEPMELDGPHLIDAGDRQVAVLSNLRHPRVVVLGGLLGDDECDQLVSLARERIRRSETFQLDDGVSIVHEGRTSEGMFFNRAENALCQRIEARIAEVCQWPIERGEGLQILRYGPGAQYKPHYDYFDPAQPGSGKVLARGGQRVASLVMYLNTPKRGGATTFPDIGLEVAPVKGNAVFFSYDRPHPMTKTLHGGAPVLEGEKWVATKWLREQAYF
jgi:prolyl 4-hydroxylase